MGQVNLRWQRGELNSLFSTSLPAGSSFPRCTATAEEGVLCDVGCDFTCSFQQASLNSSKNETNCVAVCKHTLQTRNPRYFFWCVLLWGVTRELQFKLWNDELSSHLTLNWCVVAMDFSFFKSSCLPDVFVLSELVFLVVFQQKLLFEDWDRIPG